MAAKRGGWRVGREERPVDNSFEAREHEADDLARIGPGRGGWLQPVARAAVERRAKYPPCLSRPFEQVVSERVRSRPLAPIGFAPLIVG